MKTWVELETKHQSWKYCEIKTPNAQYGLTVYNTCVSYVLLH